MEQKTRRDELLGITFGKAGTQLRRLILFNLVKLLEKDICFHCNKRIENIDELSIEHKIPWEYSNDPIKYFYDLNNIAFSHLSCNIGASNKQDPMNF